MSVGEFLNQSEQVITTIKVIIYSFFAYLGFDGTVVGANVVETLCILMTVDTVLGAIKAVVLGDNFSFRVLLKGMISKLAVLIVPMIIALVAKGLSFDFRWFVLIILNVLIVAEAFSSISNILSIKSKKNVENVDFISLLLKSVRRGLENIMNKLLATIASGVENGGQDWEQNNEQYDDEYNDRYCDREEKHKRNESHKNFPRR